MAEHRSPKPGVGGSSPSWPAISLLYWEFIVGKITTFLTEVKEELKKVTWPSKDDTIGTTAVVIVLVIVISVFLGVVDAGLSRLFNLLIG